MTLPVIVRPLAEADILSAASWYADVRTELGVEFVLAVDACLERIAEAPESFPKVHRELRRALVHRFPYLVVFRRDETAIVVSAVFHGARRPATWKRRT